MVPIVLWEELEDVSRVYERGAGSSSRCHRLIPRHSANVTFQDRQLAFPGKYEEFGVDFSTTQRLQSLICRLNQARTIIATTIDVTETICRHSQSLRLFAKISPHVEQVFQNELQQITLDMRNHARVVEELLRLSENIRLLVRYLTSRSVVTSGLTSIRATRSYNFGMETRLTRTEPVLGSSPLPRLSNGG